jgi:hypothetical protein
LAKVSQELQYSFTTFWPKICWYFN